MGNAMCAQSEAKSSRTETTNHPTGDHGRDPTSLTPRSLAAELVRSLGSVRYGRATYDGSVWVRVHSGTGLDVFAGILTRVEDAGCTYDVAVTESTGTVHLRLMDD